MYIIKRVYCTPVKLGSAPQYVPPPLRAEGFTSLHPSSLTGGRGGGKRWCKNQNPNSITRQSASLGAALLEWAVSGSGSPALQYNNTDITPAHARPNLCVRRERVCQTMEVCTVQDMRCGHILYDEQCLRWKPSAPSATHDSLPAPGVVDQAIRWVL